MARAMMTAQEAADKWAKNTGAATEAYKRGIERTTVNPMAEAAKNREGYLQGVQASVDKWARGLNRTPKEVWVQNALNLGAARLTGGVSNAKPKMVAFLDKFMPFLQQGLQRIQSMPKVTLQDRIQRAVAMMEHNANFQRT